MPDPSALATSAAAAARCSRSSTGFHVLHAITPPDVDGIAQGACVWCGEPWRIHYPTKWTIWTDRNFRELPGISRNSRHDAHLGAEEAV